MPSDKFFIHHTSHIMCTTNTNSSRSIFGFSHLLQVVLTWYSITFLAQKILVHHKNNSSKILLWYIIWYFRKKGEYEDWNRLATMQANRFLDWPSVQTRACLYNCSRICSHMSVLGGILLQMLHIYHTNKRPGQEAQICGRRQFLLCPTAQVKAT